jgi:hypothetical protein
LVVLFDRLPLLLVLDLLPLDLVPDRLLLERLAVDRLPDPLREPASESAWTSLLKLLRAPPAVFS